MTRRGVWIGAFAVLAFAQTLAYYVYLRDDPGNYNGAGASGDQVAYVDLAQQVLHGTWQGAVHYMPGLPAVIAASQLAFGDPRLGIAVVQGLIYAALVLYAARLAARAFGEAASVWAAACVGLNPAIGYYAAQALTEFLTGAVLLLLVGAIYAWARSPSFVAAGWAGALIGAAAYLRAEYLVLAVIFAAILVWLRGRLVLGQAAALIGATALVMAPWVARYAVTTGQPALYNASPFSNLVLMGTWFRVFDAQTFSELQQIETAPGSREEAIARAATVGPRPELSQRYMEQARGPYELPLGQTLSLALGNVQLNLRQFLVNHLAEAPILIWAGHTPVRQADAQNLPTTARYLIWGSELALLLLALWQSVRAYGAQETRPIALSFVAIVGFLTLVHIVVAVDERFTTPALPLVGLFAGSRLADLARGRQPAAVRYASSP
ncbi:MAG: glycosyltransferase family 39 protein [Chloroflexi bacterium]|nr:glycosyltransferase family 39 protein [Chloroflexota bacterium]